MRALLLNDGVTYSGVTGCRIIDMPDDLDEESTEIIIEEENYNLLYEFKGNEMTCS